MYQCRLNTLWVGRNSSIFCIVSQLVILSRFTALRRLYSGLIFRGIICTMLNNIHHLNVVLRGQPPSLLYIHQNIGLRGRQRLLRQGLCLSRVITSIVFLPSRTSRTVLKGYPTQVSYLSGIIPSYLCHQWPWSVLFEPRQLIRLPAF